MDELKKSRHLQFGLAALMSAIAILAAVFAFPVEMLIFACVLVGHAIVVGAILFVASRRK